MGIAVADVLRSRGALVELSLRGQEQHATAAENGTTDVLVDYVGADADGRPTEPLPAGALVAPVILGLVLAVPEGDEERMDGEVDLQSCLTHLAPGQERRVVTEIPSVARAPIAAALQDRTGVSLPDEAYIMATDPGLRRDMLRRGKAVAALLSTTDPTLYGMAHTAWPVPTDTTHRIILQLTGTATTETELIQTLLDGLTAEVMRELTEHIGHDALGGESPPAIPTAVSELTDRILRDAT